MSDDTTVKLQVAGANERDFGKGTARIDRSTFEQLGIEQGDIIEIHGQRKTAAIALPPYPEDEGLPVIRLDGLLRATAGVSMGDRVELARALINQPELLICDGLSDGLDQPALREILAILQVQRASRGLSLIATDNRMLEIIGPEDRVAVMDRGRLLFAGTRVGLESRWRDDLELRTIFEGHP
ncbi:MAG: hypothetical protein ACLFTD_09705 [Halochromatium sp.]